MKGAKVRVEPKTIHTADVDTFATLTKSAFYSNHITLDRPIDTSFLNSKALLNRLGKRKPHITKNCTKRHIQKIQSTKFMRWNTKLKAMLLIKGQITKQVKLARLATSTNSRWWL